jgi:hypothetical protein
MNQDTHIAAFVRTTGLLGMGAACGWVICLWWVRRKNSVTASEVDLAN